MRWFEGDIAQAVATSKSKNAIFVVFIEGKDEATQKTAQAIGSDLISTKLESDNFVAIRIEKDSETYTQFTQIYNVSAVPSLFFIGRSGKPIDIIVGDNDASQILERIVSVEAVHAGKGCTCSSNYVAVIEAAMSSQAESSEQAQMHSHGAAAASSQAIENLSTSQTSTSVETEQEDAATIQQRVERAKELLDLKRAQKQQEEEEDARQKELQRRKEGQGMQELKRWQQEQELKQLREERLREKRLEQEARQRVLEQIAQDRANRNAKNATAATPPPSAQPQLQPSPVSQSNSNEARLQFRLPNGSTHTHRFNADDTLGDVRQYLIANVTLPFQNFILATMFPRQEFTSEDNTSTLRALNLVPTSVVLVIPAGGHSVVNQNNPGILGMVNTTIWTMLSPIVRIFSFLRVFMFGGGASGAPTNAPSSSTASSQAQQQPQEKEKRSTRRSGSGGSSGGGAYRRTGSSNVHRLHQNHSSSDDDNNTWNGNSTQQM